MQIIRNHLSSIALSKIPNTCLTIGNFDGVHLGHLQIISQVKKIAKEKKLASAILTFEPHPISFLQSNKAKDFRLTSLAQKLKIFAEQQIDYTIILPFNKNFSEISAENFIQKILIEALKTKHLTIGYDFTFGKNREGNFKTLENSDFDLTEILPIKFNSKSIEKEKFTYSSTIARKMICEGKMAQANLVLGKNFTITGLVNEGRKLASKLGFPTANLKSKPYIIKPKFGVYKTQTFIPHLQKTFLSVTNFGIKPTLTKEGILQNEAPIFETHIFNFNQEIYGKKISVEFLDFIRDEKKFDSILSLKEQIKKDVERCLLI